MFISLLAKLFVDSTQTEIKFLKTHLVAIVLTRNQRTLLVFESLPKQKSEICITRAYIYIVARLQFMFFYRFEKLRIN